MNFVVIILSITLSLGSAIENSTEVRAHINSVSTGPKNKVKAAEQVELPEEVYQKIFSIEKNCNAFRHDTYEELKARVKNLSSWDPPSFLKENFPYYLAGYDYQRRPVWIVEIGKLNFRSVVEPGEKSVTEGKRYLSQAIFNIMKSFVSKETEGEDIREALIIFDMEGASLRQVNYLPSWGIFAELFAKFHDLTMSLVGNVILINANYITQLATDIARPVVGQLMERVEVYGSKRNVWLPRLLQLVPLDVIPPWYGGKKDFKPISVQG